MKSASKSSLTTKVVYSVALALVIYLALSIWGGSRGLNEASQTFTWQMFPAVILLALINYFFRFLKWQLYLKVLTIDIPRLDSLIISIYHPWETGRGSQILLLKKTLQ
jgi:nitric oxide reductase large subunit